MTTTFAIQVANFVGAYQSMDSPDPKKPQGSPSISDAEKQAFAAADKTWKEYSRSSNGRAQLRAIENTDIPSAQAALERMVDQPPFVKLLQFIKSLNLPSGSFTIGLNFEAELGIGVKGTIGIAIGIGDNSDVAHSTFLSVGLVEGLEAGGLAGVQFGLWRSAPADLGGYAWGTEIDLGFDVEASGAIYYSTSGRLLGVTLTLGAGVDEGIAEDENYTFILSSGGDEGYLKPVYQPRKNNLLSIESIKCHHPANDGGGNANEIYFEFQADEEGEVYPYPTYDYFSMQEGDTWNCGRSVWFNNSVKVNVYDEDDTSSDDKVGKFTINLSDLSLGQTKKFDSTKDYSSTFDNVEYTIKVKLLAQNVGR